LCNIFLHFLSAQKYRKSVTLTPSNPSYCTDWVLFIVFIFIVFLALDWQALCKNRFLALGLCVFAMCLTNALAIL